MLNLDYLTLNKFLKEESEFLKGARIQKIQQPTRQELIFSLRNKLGQKGESKKLYVNISPRFFHVCFMSKENEEKRFIKIPKKPPMFCMQLRKYIEGSKIIKIEQPEGERIVEFYFETYNELAEPVYLCLAIELMGKHSNVVLYNYDTNIIIGCAHNVGDDKSRERHLMGNLPYVYPPKAGNGKRGKFISLLEEFSDKENISAQIDNYFANFQEQEKIKSVKQKIYSYLSSKLKKTKRTAEKLERQLKTQDKAKNYRKKADLIMANLYNFKDFLPLMDVFDYDESKNVKIELDETKTLKENANKYYKLYNKAKTTNEKAQELLNSHLEEKSYLEQSLYTLECAENLKEFLELESELGLGDNNISKNSESALLEKNINGFEVYIGKNNKQNDYIVSKLSRDEDLWFHTRLCAGSHVLLKVQKGGPLPDEKTIFECAKLAKEHSSGRNSSKVGIIYTKRRFLKKPPGASLGYVIYKNEKEIIVD
jgi:predicted ribosome quality control (RQC) complex YloA/Tae2 family protein